MQFTINNRWSRSPQVTVKIDDKYANEPHSMQIGEAIRVALRSGSDLSGSNLRGSNLSGSDLRGSNLSGSNLSGSNLRGSDLSGSDLRGSNLRGSDLSGSDLSGSNLSGSNLRGSDLSGSDLRGSNLRGILDLVRVPGLHRKILAAIDGGGTLEMGRWHTCETTHCRGGWAVLLAGDAGKMLELTQGTPSAAAMIHLASCDFLEKVPDFYASNKDALADIRRCAVLETELIEVSE